MCWGSTPTAGWRSPPTRAPWPRRVQRILESREYASFFPATTIKCGSKPPGYIRTSEEIEIVGRRGGLLSVGREGSLTGNRVDCFILDDLYRK